jgi:acyl carrier protein
MTDQNSQSTQEFELSRLIISTLNLEMQAADIAPEAPLFGEGLGLDSIDILEIALAISKTYGFKLRSDDKNNDHIFSSLRSLNHHIRQHQPTQA